MLSNKINLNIAMKYFKLALRFDKKNNIIKQHFARLHFAMGKKK